MKKRQKVLLAIAAVFVLIAGIVIAEEPSSLNLNRAFLKIDNLGCGGCFSTINAGLIQLEGYSGMGANLIRKLVAVDFSAPLNPEAISQKLIEVGYPGELEFVENISQEESFAYLESKRKKNIGAAGCGIGSCGAGLPAATPSSQAGGSCCDVPVALNPTKNL